MIKAVVFDLDNTLIPWLDEFDKYIKETFEDFNLPNDNDTMLEFRKAMAKYEDTHIRFDKKEMSIFFRDYLKLEIPDNFVDVWSLKLNNAFIINDEVNKLLYYLKSKYKLYVTTNWYTDQQRTRLKNATLLDYFENVYGCDCYDRKPYPEMLEELLKEYNNNEIIYIGDSYNIDIKFAINQGVYAYHISDTNRVKSSRYKVIKSIFDLYKYL